MWRRPLILILGLACAQATSAQVFKCQVQGRTVYQAEPCAEAGQALRLERGPSAEQVREAQQRAQTLKLQGDAATVRAQHRESQARDRLQLVGRPRGGAAAGRTGLQGADCAELDAQRAQSYGWRNQSARESRYDNRDRSKQFEGHQRSIHGIEQAMRQSGCRLN